MRLIAFNPVSVHQFRHAGQHNRAWFFWISFRISRIFGLAWSAPRPGIAMCERIIGQLIPFECRLKPAMRAECVGNGNGGCLETPRKQSGARFDVCEVRVGPEAAWRACGRPRGKDYVPRSFGDIWSDVVPKARAGPRCVYELDVK